MDFLWIKMLLFFTSFLLCFESLLSLLVMIQRTDFRAFEVDLLADFDTFTF